MSKNLKLKKVNKSFVPEPISCNSGFPMSISHINIWLGYIVTDQMSITFMMGNRKTSKIINDKI